MPNYDYSVSPHGAGTAGSVYGPPSNNPPPKNTLWKLMLELGYASCEPSTLRDLCSHLQHDNPSFVLRENDVAKAVGMMMCYPSPSSQMFPQVQQKKSPNESIPGASRMLGPDSNNASLGWDIESFVTVVKEVAPKIDWTVVVKDLDYSDFYVKEAKGFELLLRAYRKAVPDFMSFPIKHLINPWKNLPGQLSLLKQALSFTCEYFSFSMFPCRRIFTPEDMASCPPSFKAMLNALFHQNWNCLDLLEYLISLFDTEYHDMVRPLLELATRESPELFCLALSSYSNWSNSSLRETLIKLVCGFIMGHNNSSIVLSKLWSINPNILLACMVDLYRKDPSCLSRTLDVSQELKILSLILESKPSSFSLDIASLASRREHLNLEKWIVDNIANKRDAFAKPCLEFLRDRIRLMIERQEGKFSVQFIPLSSEILSVFIHAIMSRAQDLSPESLELCRELQSVVMGSSQYSQPYGHPINTEVRGAPVQQPEINFPRDVEEEVNNYYERIYRHEFEIKDIIELFTSLKTSKNPRDQQVFACMIHNLFDEYQYFHGYPEKELALTATIFGILIQYQLISYVPLGIALRCIMDALKKPANSKLFKFGLQSLIQFRSRLVEWPQYCSHLLQIPHFVQIQPELAAYLKQCLITATQGYPATPGNAPVGQSLYSNIVHSAPSVFSDQHPQATHVPFHTKPMTEEEREALSQPPPVTTVAPEKSTYGGMRNFTSTASESSFTTVNINILLEAMAAKETSFETPDASFQERISFLINNISTNNFEEKLQEMTEIFRGTQYRYFQWFSSYLVVKRVSIEPNFHEIYIKLLEQYQPKQDSKQLIRFIYQETLFSVTTLIESDKTLSSSSDRTLLKNLGIWLGLLTLARNQPILQDDLCFKTLLINGYEEDRLIVIIPFVCKVLDQSIKSVAFQPNNPWLMCIIHILSELYHKIDLKLTLKFEIELLFKHLKLDLNSTEMTSLFKNRIIKKRIVPTGISSQQQKHSTQEAEQLSQSIQVGIPQSGLSVPSPFSPRIPSTDDKHLGIPSLVSYIIFNGNSQLTKMVLFAIDFAIREVAPAIIKRALAIASSTVSVLIGKDFQQFTSDDANYNLILEKTKNIMQNIVGNLTLVTGREPLRSTIISNIFNFLKIAQLEHSFPVHGISSIVEDNLDLCCAFLEKVAIDQAMKEAPTVLSSLPKFPLIAASKTDALSVSLPPERILNEYSKIYDDFVRVSRISNLSTLPVPSALPPITAQDQENLLIFLRSFNVSVPTSNAAAPVDTSSLVTVQQCMDKFNNLFHALEANQKINSNEDVKGDQEVQSIVKQITAIPSAFSAHKDEVCMLFLHKIVQYMYRNSLNPADRTFRRALVEICIELICSLSEASPRSGKEVVTWFIYSEDLRKLDATVTQFMLESGLICIPEYDMQLVRFLESNVQKTSASSESMSQKLLSFSLSLLKNVLESEKLQLNDFVSLTEYLAKNHRQNETVIEAVELRKSSTADLKMQVSFFFADWMRLSLFVAGSDATNSAQLMNTFVNQLYQQTFSKAPLEVVRSFLEFLVESALESYHKQCKVPLSTTYFPLDSFAKLIVSLIKGYPSVDLVFKKQELLGMVLESIGLKMIQMKESEGVKENNSNQKAFVRLLVQLFAEISLHYNESESSAEFQQSLVIIAQFLNEIQPENVPFFFFGWIELVSCKHLLSHFVTNSSLWGIYSSLVKSLFSFFSKLISSNPSKTRDSTQIAYKGILRFLLVLLHDFSDFLSYYALDLCDSIPHFCIQYRNLILSAFPRDLKLLDPFGSCVKIDSVPESLKSPSFSQDWKNSITPIIQLACDVKEEDIKSLVDILKQHLTSQSSLQQKYSKTNCLVTLCITRDISSGKSLHSKLLSQLVVESDNELRYLLLASIANHLRFPNTMTSFSSHLLVQLFDQSASINGIIGEQVVRVLLERLIANRPHPWGLLVTFVELIKNPSHSFWNKEFIKISPEIERMFNSVARTCMSSTSNN